MRLHFFVIPNRLSSYVDYNSFYLITYYKLEHFFLRIRSLFFIEMYFFAELTEKSNTIDDKLKKKKWYINPDIGAVI